MSGEFLTISEMAQRLHVNPRTARAICARDGLAMVRAGRRLVRIPAAALDAWIAAGGSALPRAAEKQHDDAEGSADDAAPQQ